MVRFADRYDVGAELGSGGQGTVYQAYDNNMHLDVALKLFTRGTSTRLAYNEARLLTRLEGPHILRVFNADVSEDIPYVASAIAVGGTTETPATARQVPSNVAMQWAAHLLHGLDACHRLDLVHRDIKPSNLFLDSPESARLGDFGTAALLNQGRVGAAGDPRIRAPEMWSTGFGDLRSDIYSVGVTVWHLLTGEFPFPVAKATPNDEYARLVLGGVPCRLRDMAPQVPAAIARVVERALSLDPSNRYASAHEMALAIGHANKRSRDWLRTVHDGHPRCWAAAADSSGHAALEICTREIDHRQVAVEVRKMPSGNRVRNLCAVVPQRQVNVYLRTCFDTIAKGD